MVFAGERGESASAEGASSHNRSGIPNRKNIPPTGERLGAVCAPIHRRGWLCEEPKLSGKRTEGEAYQDPRNSGFWLCLEILPMHSLMHLVLPPVSTLKEAAC